MKCSTCGKEMPDYPEIEKPETALEAFIKDEMPKPSHGRCSEECSETYNNRILN